jgi:hypothetical protein
MNYSIQLTFESDRLGELTDEQLACIWLSRGDNVRNELARKLHREIATRWFNVLDGFTTTHRQFTEIGQRVQLNPGPIDLAELMRSPDELVAVMWAMLGRCKVHQSGKSALALEVAERWISMLTLLPIEAPDGHWQRPAVTRVWRQQ